MDEPVEEKKSTKTKVVGGVVIFLLIIGIIVFFLWYYGVFGGEKPEGLQSTTGTVIGPCHEGVKDCIKIQYKILEEDKDNGRAEGRTEIEIETTELKKDIVSKYKAGDELIVEYYKVDPTLVYSYAKK